MDGWGLCLQDSLADLGYLVYGLANSSFFFLFDVYKLLIPFNKLVLIYRSKIGSILINLFAFDVIYGTCYLPYN